MCDLGPLRKYLAFTVASILTAVGLIVAAAVANGSFFGAVASPGLMIAAGLATIVAMALCGAALNALEVFCRCAGRACAGACSNFRNTLKAGAILLGIQATACFVAAGIAWIPWAGQAPMWAIAGALILQVVLLISAFFLLGTLSKCQSTEPGLPPSPPVTDIR